ncbi:hypothetical protein D9757_015130 [Collybiopsis confluens]|uniref:Ubiquitin-like protease family profile domain-containing protein n=1 Tax=Collybiopsis confluens TaxID=2823264 RepID=A0A8H5CGT8_9AGAR|nr:hypothetical protein D9757_015130 [Collybiopsis confluens]
MFRHDISTTFSYKFFLAPFVKYCPVLLDALPSAEDACVTKLFRQARNSPKSVLIKIFNITLRAKDIRRLQPGEWFSDEVINAYVNLLIGSTAPDIYIFHTYFWSWLLAARRQRLKFKDYPSLAGYHKRHPDILSYRLLLFPCHVNKNHWVCCALDVTNGTVTFFDSLFGSHKASHVQWFKNAKEWYELECQLSNKMVQDLSLVYQDISVPQQDNGCDCGVFTLAYMQSLSTGNLGFDFSQKDMPFLRRRLTLEFLQGELYTQEEITENERDACIVSLEDEPSESLNLLMKEFSSQTIALPSPLSPILENTGIEMSLDGVVSAGKMDVSSLSAQAFSRPDKDVFSTISPRKSLILGPSAPLSPTRLPFIPETPSHVQSPVVSNRNSIPGDKLPGEKLVPEKFNYEALWGRGGSTYQARSRSRSHSPKKQRFASQPPSTKIVARTPKHHPSSSVPPGRIAHEQTSGFQEPSALILRRPELKMLFQRSKTQDLITQWDQDYRDGSVDWMPTRYAQEFLLKELAVPGVGIRDWEVWCLEMVESSDQAALRSFVHLQNLLEIGEKELGFEEFIGGLSLREQNVLKSFGPYFRKARAILERHLKQQN